MIQPLPKPDWRVWLNDPAPCIWECVALSFNISPRSIETTDTEHPCRQTSWSVVAVYFEKWLAGQSLLVREEFQIPDLFQPRLQTAIRHAKLGGALLPYVIQHEPDSPSKARLPLWRFGAWAASMGWRLPDEFPTVAPPGSAEPTKAEPVPAVVVPEPDALPTDRKKKRANTQSAPAVAPVNATAPLRKKTMADVFDGIGGKSTDAWMRTLGDLQHAAWARPALATAGGKGKSSTWWPVRFAKELLDRETADCPALNQLFITSRPLRPWLSEWQELISERAWRKRDLQR